MKNTTIIIILMTFAGMAHANNARAFALLDMIRSAGFICYKTTTMGVPDAGSCSRYDRAVAALTVITEARDKAEDRAFVKQLDADPMKLRTAQQAVEAMTAMNLLRELEGQEEDEEEEEEAEEE